jgi:hypothetical protein
MFYQVKQTPALLASRFKAPVPAVLSACSGRQNEAYAEFNDEESPKSLR